MLVIKSSQTNYYVSFLAAANTTLTNNAIVNSVVSSAWPSLYLGQLEDYSSYRTATLAITQLGITDGVLTVEVSSECTSRQTVLELLTPSPLAVVDGRASHTFTLAITNNDSGFCPPLYFDFTTQSSPQLPQGWRFNSEMDHLFLEPQRTCEVSFSLDPNDNAAALSTTYTTKIQVSWLGILNPRSPVFVTQPASP